MTTLKDNYELSVEQSREGLGIQPGGISGSAKRGTKRKLEVKSFQEKYAAIMEVEKGLKTNKKNAEEFGVPQNTLSTWISTVFIDATPDDSASYQYQSCLMIFKLRCVNVYAYRFISFFSAMCY